MRCLIMLAVLISAGANAEIYKCVEEGKTTYSNSPARGCVRLNVGPVNTVPAPKPAGSASARNATPGDFPRIDSGTQRARDDDRRRILDQELSNEQSALDAARQNLSAQESTVLPEERNVAGKGINAGKIELRLKPLRDKVALHERNIEALRKEIGNLR